MFVPLLKASDYRDLDIITLVMLSVKIRGFDSHYRYIEIIQIWKKFAISSYLK